MAASRAFWRIADLEDTAQVLGRVHDEPRFSLGYLGERTEVASFVTVFVHRAVPPL